MSRPAFTSQQRAAIDARRGSSAVPLLALDRYRPTQRRLRVARQTGASKRPP